MKRFFHNSFRSSLQSSFFIVGKLNSYIQLTKPSIMLLVVLSGATALFLEGSLLALPLRFGMVLLALYLTGGCANALNQILERDLDKQMSRTKKKRPLPLGQISLRSAWVFTLSIGFLGGLIFWWYFSILPVLLAGFTILFYSFFYTLYLKPRSPQNIVIGGIAGSLPPVIAWACTSSSFFEMEPWLLFLIIFFWTPPHFWALALFCKEDYKKIGMPMLPVVRGEKNTLKQIGLYSWILIPLSLGFVFSVPFSEVKWIYLALAIMLGIVWLRKSRRMQRSPSEKNEKNFFAYSILYLLGLLLALILDSLLLTSTVSS